jgi:hypothetical protein
MTKFLMKMAALAMIGGVMGGCAYGGVATSNGNAVVLRNEGFLFGMLRKAYVCKVEAAGLTNCQSTDSP